MINVKVAREAPSECGQRASFNISEVVTAPIDRFITEGKGPYPDMEWAVAGGADAGFDLSLTLTWR